MNKDLNKRIVYTMTDGSVRIGMLAPECELTIEQVAVRDRPEGADDAIIIKSRELPFESEPHNFRPTWVFDKVIKKFSHDMIKAKELHKQRLRLWREPKLAELDKEYMKADEAGDNQKKKEIAAKKEKLRNITANPEIEAAQTIEELKLAAMGDLA